jgi:hypothetical protein
MRTVKLTKIKNDYVLIVPESIAKLYTLEKGQVFNLEVREGKTSRELVFLTYATTTK